MFFFGHKTPQFHPSRNRKNAKKKHTHLWNPWVSQPSNATGTAGDLGGLKKHVVPSKTPTVKPGDWTDRSRVVSHFRWPRTKLPTRQTLEFKSRWALLSSFFWLLGFWFWGEKVGGVGEGFENPVKKTWDLKKRLQLLGTQNIWSPAVFARSPGVWTQGKIPLNYIVSETQKSKAAGKIQSCWELESCFLKLQPSPIVQAPSIHEAPQHPWSSIQSHPIPIDCCSLMVAFLPLRTSHQTTNPPAK